LTVRVLGPLEVWVGGRRVGLTSGRLRTVLAVLAMAAGGPVSVERLGVALWGEDAPGSARRVVQTYLARLRAALGAGVVGTGPAGYSLRVEPDQVDAVWFVQQLDLAGGAPDRSVERGLLDRALALWRGDPFEGVASAWLEQFEAPRLQERYLAAVERRADLDLAAGRAGQLVPRLRELAAQHPLRETLWARLLRALGQSGRQAEALERYEAIRSHLAEELGSDPGAPLRQIYADLLAGQPPPADTDPVVAGPASPAGSVVPRQLPADIVGFAGRAAALKALHDLVPDGEAATASAVVISAIAGTAGVGKTALAVHWAHQVADRFPAGQLYVNLRGFGPSGRTMEPAEAVRGFLDALGVPRQRIPPEFEAQVGLYRSLLADKRMLILLDNARDADQVRPLIPGTPGCLVVVTSRNQLTGLVASETARPLLLDLLDLDEARQLLAGRLGTDRITTEPDAADEIIHRCARLPLALAIVAAHAATRPEWPLAAAAGQLRDAQAGLDAFTGADPATNIRAVFSWSYQSLTPAAATLFRQLGLHPGPDLTTPAAASLAALR
jgi:DNA-binding SARP family transcriptional activator